MKRGDGWVLWLALMAALDMGLTWWGLRDASVHEADPAAAWAFAHHLWWVAVFWRGGVTGAAGWVGVAIARGPWPAWARHAARWALLAVWTFPVAWNLTLLGVLYATGRH